MDRPFRYIQVERRPPLVCVRLKQREFRDTELEDLGCDWLAVIHADGNGLGQVFLRFDKFASGDPDYIDKLGRFSLTDRD